MSWRFARLMVVFSSGLKTGANPGLTPVTCFSLATHPTFVTEHELLLPLLSRASWKDRTRHSELVSFFFIFLKKAPKFYGFQEASEKRSAISVHFVKQDLDARPLCQLLPEEPRPPLVGPPLTGRRGGAPRRSSPLPAPVLCGGRRERLPATPPSFGAAFWSVPPQPASPLVQGGPGRARPGSNVPQRPLEKTAFGSRETSWT